MEQAGTDETSRVKERDGEERAREGYEKRGGDYVGRRKRGDKEATSNARRDEQDGRTRRLRTRTEKCGEEEKEGKRGIAGGRDRGKRREKRERGGSTTGIA